MSHFLRIAVPTSLLALTSALAWGQQTEQKDLSSIDLEDLMKMKVTTAAKHEVSLFDAPVATTVIRQEDIERSGVRTIPDLLRMVPGVQVAQNSNGRWAISARGFAGDYANKLLVMIDGRSVYLPIFSGVNWDNVDVNFEDIERIEVIRGPGGSMWGANAVNGIINIITKNSRDTSGTYVEQGLGSTDRNLTQWSTSQKLDSQTSFRLAGKYRMTSPNPYPDGSRGDDGFQRRSLAFRVDHGTPEWTEWTASARFSSGNADNALQTNLWNAPTPAPGSGRFGSSAFMFKWGQQSSTKVRTNLQASYSSDRHELIEDDNDSRSLDIDLQRQWTEGNHDVVFGLGYRQFHDFNVSTIGLISFNPSNDTLHTGSAFIQDDIALSKLDHLSIGSKFLLNTYTGFEYQPSLRFAHKVNDDAMFWSSVTRAVRLPSRQDQAIAANLWEVNGGTPMEFRVSGADTTSEIVTAYEAGFRRTFEDIATVDVALFYNHYDQLRGIVLDSLGMSSDPTPHVVANAHYSNTQHGDNAGIELSCKWKATPKLNFDLDYSYFAFRVTHSNDTNGDDMTNVDDTPRHQASLRGSYDAGKGCRANVWLTYTDTKREAITNYLLQGTQGGSIPANWRLDLSLNYKPTPKTEWTLAFQNLLAPYTREDVQAFFEKPTSVERNVYLGVKLSF